MKAIKNIFKSDIPLEGEVHDIKDRHSRNVEDNSESEDNFYGILKSYTFIF